MHNYAKETIQIVEVISENGKDQKNHYEVGRADFLLAGTSMAEKNTKNSTLLAFISLR